MNDKKLLNFNVSGNGFKDDESARAVVGATSTIIRVLSEHIDLTSLVGVSIGYDYQAELNSVDRGVETSISLTPSAGDVVGVAMVVRVIRDGKPRCHLVFNAAYLEGVISPLQSDEWMSSVAIIAHECAHVSNNAALNKCFPDLLMNYRYKDIHESLRGECWLSVMEEYCATRLSAHLGVDNNNMYKETFLKQARKLQDTTKNEISSYRKHGDVDRVLKEVYGEIELTLKLAAYFLGDSSAKGFNFKEIDGLNDENLNWLIPYIERLDLSCDDIFNSYGEWKSLREMEVISDILDEMAIDVGVIVKKLEGHIWVDIP